MNTAVLFRVVAIGLISMALQTTACATEPNAVATQLQRISTEHPRLFFNDSDAQDIRTRIESDKQMSAVWSNIVKKAESLLEVDPLKREKVGKRLLGVSRDCLQRVAYLAFVYRISGDEPFLRRAEAEMVAAAGFSDWNPDHFLDVAEMTTALAIGYDWLYDDLDPRARETIRQAIIEKGLETSLKGGWWVTSTNNWNQVCHGGMTIGALAVAEDAPELAGKIIARAVEMLPIAMGEYKPDGVYPEGPSYWAYGTSYNVLLLAALDSALGTSFGLADQPGFMQTPEFYLHATGPTGLFFNYSDCGERGGLSPAMHWFAGKLDRTDLLWNEKKLLDQLAADTGAENGRLLPFLLIWGHPLSELEPPTSLNWQGDGRTPVAMMRSGWDERATYIGIKGGSPGSNHAHMDAGSFVLDRDGVRWAIDLGAQDYNSLESIGLDLWNRAQDSERWTVFRLSNTSHNTLVIDGKGQLVTANAPVERFSDSADDAFAIVNLAPVLEGQLKQARRGVALQGRNVLVQDEIETLIRPATIRWGMVTRAEVAIDETAPGKAVLSQNGETLALQVVSPGDAVLRLYETENPPQDYDVKNRNTRMIGFEIVVPENSSQRIAVHLGDAGAAPSDLKPLSAW